MRSKTNLKNTSPPSLSFLGSPSSLPLSQGMRVVVCSSHVVSVPAQVEDCSPSPAPVWGPSHRSQCSMKFSSVSLSHGLQLNLLSLRCHHHLCWAQPWPAGGCILEPVALALSDMRKVLAVSHRSHPSSPLAAKTWPCKPNTPDNCVG